LVRKPYHFGVGEELSGGVTRNRSIEVAQGSEEPSVIGLGDGIPLRIKNVSRLEVEDGIGAIEFAGLEIQIELLLEGRLFHSLLETGDSLIDGPVGEFS